MLRARIQPHVIRHTGIQKVFHVHHSCGLRVQAWCIFPIDHLLTGVHPMNLWPYFPMHPFFPNQGGYSPQLMQFALKMFSCAVKGSRWTITTRLVDLVETTCGFYLPIRTVESTLIIIYLGERRTHNIGPGNTISAQASLLCIQKDKKEIVFS